MMRISISQDNVNFKPVEVSSLDEFVKYATTHNYSTGTFRDNYRNKANFIEAECIAIDVDNEDPQHHYTIEEAKAHFAEYRHIIMPSKSHQKDKNGRVADRFRVVLFLESPIGDAKDFTATWGDLFKFYPAADRACQDASRFFYPSPQAYSVNEQGRSWPVTQYVEPVREDIDIALSTGDKGQLSRETLNFLTYGAMPGQRNPKLFKAAKDMQEQGFTVDECKARVSSMISVTGNWGTNYLNAKDIEAIENAFKDEPKYEARPLPEESRRSVFNFQTLDQMLAEAGNIDWLVDGLLTKGGFSLIVGPPKAGKSTLVRQLVRAVCRGEEFLGRTVKEGSVVYLTFEEQPAILKEQFETLGITAKDPIVIHAGAVFDDRALEDLHDALIDFGPSLVILDTIFDISNLEDINNYKAVKDSLARIRDIARTTGSHILGVHHSNKLGGFMGSQAIFGAVDTMIKFFPARDQRFVSSTGKYGEHFNDRELIWSAVNGTYTPGDKKERKTGGNLL